MAVAWIVCYLAMGLATATFAGRALRRTFFLSDDQAQAADTYLSLGLVAVLWPLAFLTGLAAGLVMGLGWLARKAGAR